MKSIAHPIAAALSVAALALAPGMAGAQDNERAPGRSTSTQGVMGDGAASGARGGKGTESMAPYTGNPGRTGSAATAEGAPSRDPTAGRNERRPGTSRPDDNERVPGESSGVHPGPIGGGAASPGRGGTGTESSVPYTGNPGRTGAAGTAEGVPSRDPTASRGKHEEAPIPGSAARSGNARSPGTDGAKDRSAGEAAGKGTPMPSVQR